MMQYNQHIISHVCTIQNKNIFSQIDQKYIKHVPVLNAEEQQKPVLVIHY